MAMQATRNAAMAIGFPVSQGDPSDDEMIASGIHSVNEAASSCALMMQSIEVQTRHMLVVVAAGPGTIAPRTILLRRISPEIRV